MPLFGDSVKQPRDLFLNELSEMLYVERTLAHEVLPELKSEVRNRELAHGIEQHLDQTRKHIRNVEQVFQMMGADPEAEKSHSLDGLVKTHSQMAKKIESDSLRDLFDAGAAAKTEHLEIAGYKSLISMAETMGEQDAARLLRENCEQEEMTLREVERISESLNRELVGVR